MLKPWTLTTGFPEMHDLNRGIMIFSFPGFRFATGQNPAGQKMACSSLGRDGGFPSGGKRAGRGAERPRPSRRQKFRRAPPDCRRAGSSCVSHHASPPTGTTQNRQPQHRSKPAREFPPVQAEILTRAMQAIRQGEGQRAKDRKHQHGRHPGHPVCQQV